MNVCWLMLGEINPLKDAAPKTSLLLLLLLADGCSCSVATCPVKYRILLYLAMKCCVVKRCRTWFVSYFQKILTAIYMQQHIKTYKFYFEGYPSSMASLQLGKGFASVCRQSAFALQLLYGWPWQLARHQSNCKVLFCAAPYTSLQTVSE